jgi:hypothetical protein
MVLSRYRVRYRVAMKGGEVVIRWRSIAAGPLLRKEMLFLCRRAMGGEVRISIGHEGSAIRAVMTNLHEIRRWCPEESDFPAQVHGEWARELAKGDRRSNLTRAIRALLREAVSDELLSLDQGAAIAHAVSLALDGLGPFSPSSGRRR